MLREIFNLLAHAAVCANADDEVHFIYIRAVACAGIIIESAHPGLMNIHKYWLDEIISTVTLKASFARVACAART